MELGRDAIAREIAELFSAKTPIVYLVTSDEMRAVVICKLAAQALRATDYVWSVHRGLSPLAPDARDPMKMLDSLSRAPSPSLAVLLDFHELWRDPMVARRVRDLLPALVERGYYLAVVAPRVELPDGLAGDTAILRLPLPDRAELESLLEMLSGRSLPAEFQHQAVMAATGLTFGQAKRAFLRALRASSPPGEESLSVILAEKRRILAQDLCLEYVDRTEKLDAVGGLESLKEWIAERALAFQPTARNYGLSEPRGIMLLGVQGCGKSLSAKCVAAEFGVPLLRLDLARLVGTRNGSAEETLAVSLAAAEAIAPVVLWADEIEKAFAGSGSGEGRDSGASRLLGAFSTWLQERHGAVFVVATANDVTKLPPELLRRGRFDELFFVDLPDRLSRSAIISFHLRKRGRDPERYDLTALADQCANYSGAELEQIVVGALHRAFSQRRDLADADLRRIARDIVPLSTTYEEQIKALREWASGRTRPAGREAAVVDLFRVVS